MPVQKKQSPMFAKYGNKLDSAVKKHADDSTDYGPQRIPGGIKNGISRLTECGFFQYDKDTKMKLANGKSAAGEYYFRAVGTVVEPEFITTPEGQHIRVRGMQTSVMEPMIDTKASTGKVVTQEEHVENVLNELRKLGGEDYTKGATAADLEDLAAGLKAAAPYFNFSTSEGKSDPTRLNPATKKPYEPRIWENWYGSKGLEDYVPPDVARENTTDNTDNVPAESQDDGVEDAQNDVEEQSNNLEALVAAAQDDSDETAMVAAQTRLRDLLIEAGGTQDDFDNAENWEAVVEMINNGSGGGGGGEDAAAAEPEPEKGGTCDYTVVDAKTKKSKKVQCEITAVNAGKRTVTLKNLTTGKPVVGKDNKALAVSWDAIELT